MGNNVVINGLVLMLAEVIR